MLSLVVGGLFSGLFAGAVILGLSAVFAFAAKVSPIHQNLETLALVSSGVLPIGVVGFSVISVVLVEGNTTGAAAQGLVIMLTMSAFLFAVVWPVAYRINLKILGD